MTCSQLFWLVSTWNCHRGGNFDFHANPICILRMQHGRLSTTCWTLLIPYCEWPCFPALFDVGFVDIMRRREFSSFLPFFRILTSQKESWLLKYVLHSTRRFVVDNFLPYVILLEAEGHKLHATIVCLQVCSHPRSLMWFLKCVVMQDVVFFFLIIKMMCQNI